jgi:Protein of unknown function (DUF559)
MADHALAERILCQGLSSWPGQTASGLKDRFEDAVRGRAVFLCLPLKAGATPSLDVALDGLLRTVAGVVFALFPAWLPEGAGIERPGGGGLLAIENVARSVANSTELFAPFLVRMASAALKKEEPDISDFPREVVAAETLKLLRRAFLIERIILILSPENGTDDFAVARQERAVIWMHEHSSFVIWVVGAVAARMPRIPVQTVIGRDAGAKAVNRTGGSTLVDITPLAGRPNPLSRSEQRLEVRLASLSWARGRAWNQTWVADSLHNPICVDLIWKEEKCVVELDGVDHLDPGKFRADRRRDRMLQLAGYIVLRFTNEDIHEDLEQITSLLERIITSRRESSH